MTTKLVISKCETIEQKEETQTYLLLTRLSLYGFLGCLFIMSDSGASYASEIAGIFEH